MTALKQEDGPAFCEPWQAQAFALANALIDKGVFTADEWANTLGAEIKRAQAAGDPDTGETYYNHWLAALERLCAEKGLALGDEVSDRAEEWRNAYLATPHGQPVALK
ncbi:MAG: nitrile hydratase accessory protein [Rhodospirillaceae bacterium]|nr:nitrile hydratase accessory protein [Magnetovibrio sp.]MAY67513.1 nitrile hydratase accessory protein [Rhodospirillaceae bacterium]